MTEKQYDKISNFVIAGMFVCTAGLSLFNAFKVFENKDIYKKEAKAPSSSPRVDSLNLK